MTTNAESGVEPGVARTPSVVDRITVALIPKASEDLQRLQDRTSLSKTDIANRAITLYEFIDSQLRTGHDVLIRDNEHALVTPHGWLDIEVAVRFLEEGDQFDAATGVNHEIAAVRNEAGEERAFDLWTTCFTPRELRLLAGAAGLAVEGVWSVRPGAYARCPPDLDHPEFLVVARAGTR